MKYKRLIFTKSICLHALGMREIDFSYQLTPKMFDFEEKISDFRTLLRSLIRSSTINLA